MADVFMIRSDDAEAIRGTCLDVHQRMASLSPECTVDRFEGKGWALVTGRNPHVPYAASSDSRGVGVVIGSTFNQNGPRVSDLRNMQQAIRLQAAREYCRQLNYGVALNIGENEIIVTTDYLGLYPIYYYKNDSAFIVTSSPGMLLGYKGFRPAINIHGLVGILLLAHSVLGHTIFRDVFRLARGHVLKYGVDGRVKQEEVPLHAGPASPKTMDEAVEAFDSVLSTAVGSAIRERVQSVLLSGGLDSRIVAGYLHRLSDGELSAVTLGDRLDLEMRAADLVTSAIGAKHEAVPVVQTDYPSFVQRALNDDAMCSGLYALNYFPFTESLRRPILTGFHGDPVMGASHVEWSKEPVCNVHTFNAMFTKVNSWGLSPGVVRELVRDDDIDDIILEVWKRLKDEYYSYPGEPGRQSWWFDLDHRQRFLVGRLPKLIALRSWPVLPYVYPALFELALATPLSLLSDRKVQMKLAMSKFPALARLPLAGNVDRKWKYIASRKTRPWSPYTERVKDSISWHMHHKLNYPDRRYFVRVFDFNGEGWKVLRDQARIQALETDAWLRKDLVHQLIPPSSEQVQFNLPISEATGRRTLIGTVLCCSQYFAMSQVSDSI